MPLDVPRSVLALAVRHILRFAVDLRSLGPSLRVVGIHILHEHDQTGTGRGQRTGRLQFHVSGYAMQPDYHVPRANLSMNGLTIRTALNATGAEAKSGDQKIMRCGNICANKYWDDFLH